MGLKIGVYTHLIGIAECTADNLFYFSLMKINAGPESHGKICVSFLREPLIGITVVTILHVTIDDRKIIFNYALWLAEKI